MDFRTPRFNLDNCTDGARRPALHVSRRWDSQLLGEPISGNPFDRGAVQLPRGPNGRALVGDPRDDENRIVAQLHAIFLRFHNGVIDLTPKTDQLPGHRPAGSMALPVGPGQRLPAHGPGRADVQEHPTGSL